MPGTLFEMENSGFISLQTIIKDVIEHLTNGSCKNSSVIKVNNDNLLANGELHFIPSLKAWTSILQGDSRCSNEQCATILQHFLHMRGKQANGKTDADTAEEAFQFLISASENWSIKIKKCSLQRERVSIFLDRVPLTTNVIRMTVQNSPNFARCLAINKVFHFKSYHDEESELTTRRLGLIRKVTEKVLRTRGCQISNKEGAKKIIFTTKSEGEVEENCKKYICGVVKNLQSNTKETSLTWEEHVGNKINELEELNQEKYFEMEECSLNKKNLLKNMALAEVTFELLATKPSRPVFIGHKSTADRSMTNTKGASFVLYNTARIATIIEKYNVKRLKGEYPNLPDVNDVDFSMLQEEEEWELTYNFILGYQEMIRDCLTCESSFQTSPQVICLFLSRLCQKFSIYYRRIRILTESYDHLIPTMTARLYMLRALQTVLQNTLALLDIDSVSRM